MAVNDTTDGSRTMFPGVDRSVATLIVALALLAGIANAIGAFYFWRSPFTTLNQLLLCASLGGLVSQPSLIAIWWATSRQSVFLRTFYCASLLFLLFSSYMIAVNHVAKTNEISLPMVFALVALGICGITGIPMLIASRKMGFRIGMLEKTKDCCGTPQITIRQLFLLVTGASLVCAVAPMCFPNQQIQNTPMVPWRAITTFLIAFVFHIAAIANISVLHAYSVKRLKLVTVAVVTYLLLSPVIVFAYLKHHSAFGIAGPITLSGLEILLLIYAFSITLYLVHTAVLWITRCLGYGYTFPRPS